MQASTRRGGVGRALGAAGVAAAVVVAGWALTQAFAQQVALGQGRSIADMVEHIGRWASQYGGVHARTEGVDAALPGNFLVRRVYGAEAAASDAAGQRAALQHLEAYHWKNPALVQREVADVVASSGSAARYRLTARSVLNPNNAPDATEQEALRQLADGQRQEWWTTQGRELVYARTVIAQPSCLSCHGAPEKAPDFLRANPQFNGGGGFGYVAGQPAGLIAVRLPMPGAAALWQQAGVGLLGAAALLLLGLGGLAGWRWRRPAARVSRAAR